jgi:hypothetical protein
MAAPPHPPASRVPPSPRRGEGRVGGAAEGDLIGDDNKNGSWAGLSPAPMMKSYSGLLR